MTVNLSGCTPFHTELSLAIAAALASGTHRDRHLLLLHERLREIEQCRATVQAGADRLQTAARSMDIRYRSLLRSLVSTPARTPLGIAAKFSIACAMDGQFEAAQLAPAGPAGCHVFVSVFLDILAQAQLIPAPRLDRPQ